MKKLILRLATLATLATLAPLVLVNLITITNEAHAAEFTVGKHYFPLSQTQPVQSGNKIEVREIFWYGCPHCNALQPFMHKWLAAKPAKAEYVAMPAVFRKSWALHARAYYTFQSLGLVEKLHGKFFAAIHIHGKAMQNAEAVVDFAVANGAERAQFLEAMTSFSVETNLRRATLNIRKYEITGVPAIIVDGKYRASVASAGGHEALLELIDFLVAKAAAQR